jgi:hypothetical protein
MYKSIILPMVLCACETWSLTLREEHELRVFEHGVLRIFGPRMIKLQEGRGNCILGSFLTHSLHQV